MTQLVGQRCVVCKEPIRTTLDGCFCKGCSHAVHNSCARSDGSPASPTHCPQCGGNPSLHLAPDFGARGEAATSVKEPSPKQSRLGMASALLLVLGAVLASVDMYKAADFASWQQRGPVIIATMCVSFLGLALGILGLNNHGRRKLVAALGTCFNLLVFGWAILLYFMVNR